MDKEITLKLADGTRVTGLSPSDYCDPTDINKCRYVGPGLVVIVKRDLDDGPLEGLYEIANQDDQMVFNSLIEGSGEALPYTFGPTTWQNGTVQEMGAIRNAEITMIVSSYEGPNILPHTGIEAMLSDQDERVNN